MADISSLANMWESVH